MSKHVLSETTETRYEYGYICDSCQTEIEDAQETLHWRMTGGYSSIFGDGVQMELDLCQECIKTRLGDVIRFLPGNVHFPELDDDDPSEAPPTEALPISTDTPNQEKK